MKSLYYTLSKQVASLIERAKMTEHTFMVMVALIIGALAGFGAIGIRTMIKAVSDIFFSGEGNLLQNIMTSPWYVILFVPALGGLIVGPLIYFLAREAKGHGVPEVMQSIIMKGGAIRPRVAIVKAIASSITIGTGGSVGREGPIVQIGASLGSTIGQFFRVSTQRMKTFVACGAAAGIAAAFNAPIAGALFAVEIILGDFGFTQFSPIVIASVMATVVSHQFEGNFAAFQVPTYHLNSPYELIFYFLLAFLCAAVAYMFIKTLYWSEEFFEEKVKIPEYLQPAIGGLLIGAMALLFPQIMGVGYDSINHALHGDTIWHIAFLLIFLKIIATSITLGSGGSGGIFAPSLFLGAMTGVGFGSFVHDYFPTIAATPGAYALVAMGGLVAATTHAPITAIIIVFELTNDYRIILPLMIVCIISTIVSQKFSRESIYTLKLVQRNIHIKDGAEINVMKSIFVKDVYTTHAEPIPVTSTFDQVVNHLISGKDPYSPVLDSRGRLYGIISMHDVKDYLFERDILRDVLIASDIANTEVSTITPEDNCQDVLDIISKYDLEGMPVVDVQNRRRVLGMVWRKDILDAYNKEIERRDITSSFASRITMPNIDQGVHFMEGYTITEIPAPRMFIGKSIKEIGIRANYGVDVLLIRSNTNQGSKIKAIPDPDYVISYDDSLVIAGEIGKINLLKSRI
ncbi:MAG TPA: chloride channel protein [Spirochaetota bacterium]|nr:chloride channel protein [Spirochaetota bacterium]